MRSDDLLVGQGYRFDMNSLTVEVGGSDPRPPASRAGRLLHEFDHLTRMLGTSYGMLRYSLASLYLHHFLSAYHRVGTVEGVRADWQRAGQTVPAALPRPAFDALYFGGQSLSDVYRARSFRSAMHFLDGRNLTEYGLGTLAAGSEAVLRISRPGGCDADETHSMLERLWATPRPRTELVYIDGRPLRVHDVLEYLGVVVEVAYVQRYGGGDREFPAELDPRLYLQVLNAVGHYLPRAVNVAEGLFAQEVEGLLELALWPPVWPGMAAGRISQSGLDLIPSYRLHHILQACDDLGCEFSFGPGSDDVTEISPRVKKLQEQICAHLGWATPWEIAAGWVEGPTVLERAGSDGWRKHFFHHPRSRRTAWAKLLLAECGPAPVAGAMLAGSRHYGRIGFPAYIDDDEWASGYQVNPAVVDWPEADRDYRRMDGLLFTSSLAAPEAGDWAYLPDVVRTEAAETWARTPLGVDG